MPKVTDMRIELVDYLHDGQLVRGSNLLYQVDGKPSSSRVPWVAASAAAEVARIERLLLRQRRTVSACPDRQPKTQLSTVEDSEK